MGEDLRNGSASTPAQTVGNQFVSQYYTVLHSSPKHLHRFYASNSTLTYVDMMVENGCVTQKLKHANGQRMINETFMSLSFTDITTEIYSVDSQYSLDGGVIVQVTGALQEAKGTKRSFVQTFFLAVQEKGFYVLNDIFRYLLPSSEIINLPKQVADEQTTRTRDSSDSLQAGSKSSSPGQQGLPETVSKDTPVSFQVESTLEKDTKVSHTPETVVYREKDHAKTSDREMAGSETNGPKDSNKNLTTTEGIFIRDIPSGVTYEQLLKALEEFGPLKPNSLSLKSMKGRDSYAFVDFTSIEHAQACLEKGMVFNGKQVSLEPKRPTIMKQTSTSNRKPKSGHSNARQSGKQMSHMPINMSHYSGMQFPHPHMVLYPSGTIGVPVPMGYSAINAGMVPHMQPPPPPPPPGINAYVDSYDKSKSTKQSKATEALNQSGEVET
jgi:hypothetical protein